jgi:metal-dependent amidase/aminoacylase/carboxypeptidase family protein|tara:strand:+ start:418 stop:630 length:213 start_codon:yes stop_codon:yes gene_type:complete
MVVDQSISEALNRIAENQEEMTATLNRIANHYDGVVPVMTRNQKRVERAQEEAEDSFGQQVKNIFKPQAN